ncbi:MAG: AglZ/HisF2 family acetamidino modification protein [Bacteroidia bacterium]
MHNGGLVKTIRFKQPRYVGDPINTVKIFNEKEVDEIIVLDISATTRGAAPALAQIREIASECFMPLCYGGGIHRPDQARDLFLAGVEKVAFNTAAHENPQLITTLARSYGSQSVVVSIDVKKDLLGRYRAYIRGGKTSTGMDPVAYARRMEDLGAGELVVYAIDRDGTYEGYDTDLLARVCSEVSIPVIACGGASGLDDLRRAVTEGHASAVGAGSMFVFKSKERGVLINYPSQQQLNQHLYTQVE